MHNVKGHNKAAATKSVQTPSFSSATYLERLMAELDRAAISSRIQQAREQARLTQEELADALHVHRRSVQNWESPKLRLVPFDRLDDIARVTGADAQWLWHGDATPNGDRLEAVLEEVSAVRAEVQRVLAVVEQLREDRAQAKPDTRPGR
jgi:transcriptional regulator with XRE-family HTH domain